MARLSTTIILSLALLFSLVLSSSQQEEHFNNNDFVRAMDRKKLTGFKKEKLSHFRFYWHDTYTGKNPSAVAIVQPSNRTKTSTLFGSVSMIDDPLTNRPDPGSRLLGRAQGFYGSASQSEAALIMAMNLHFVQGKYNGSTITILGRNPVFDKVREMPVIGGSGLFRFARGFARASTHTVDLATGDAVVEYNVYVLHYG